PGDHPDQRGRDHPRLDGLAHGTGEHGERGRARRRGRPDPEAHRRPSREARPAGRREEAGHGLPRRELRLMTPTSRSTVPAGPCRARRRTPAALLVLSAAVAALVLGGCRTADRALTT